MSIKRLYDILAITLMIFGMVYGFFDNYAITGQDLFIEGLLFAILAKLH